MDRSTIIHTLRDTAAMLEKTAKAAKPDVSNELVALVYETTVEVYRRRAMALREAAEILERLN